MRYSIPRTLLVLLRCGFVSVVLQVLAPMTKTFMSRCVQTNLGMFGRNS
jgi:hypothetical protein